jgi:LysM domain
MLTMPFFSKLLFFLLSLAVGTFAQGTTPSGPTQPGTTPTCNKWYTVKSGDGCYSVETAFGITHAQFISWNPSVSNDCLTNFWLGYAYCIGVGSVVTPSPSSIAVTSTSRTSISSRASTSNLASTSSLASSRSSTIITTASVNATYSIRNPITSYNLSTPTTDRTWPPTKTQVGQPSYCNKWYLVEGGDTCELVYRKFGSTMSKEEL